MLINDKLSPFFGVIEGIDDPDKLDRYQVRCYGYHTHEKGFMPTDYLQWFFAMSQGSGVSGIGESGAKYSLGTTVFGFFVDKELQIGLIMGALKGKPTTKLFTNMGFSDPSGVYPLYVNESDVNRIARNESIEKTIVGWKRNNRIENIPGADGNTWSEPENTYDAVYPNNKVFETESGHVVEYDDTPGAERISINHRTGTHDEYLPDGSKVTKVMRNSFNIFLGSSFVFVNGNVNQVVNGNVQQNILGEYRCKASSIVFDSDVKILGTSEATDHISSGVSGKSHTHTQAPDSNGNTQQPTNAPSGSGSGFEKSEQSTLEIQFELFDPEIRKQ